MNPLNKLARLLLGDDPRLRRLIIYWFGTCLLYVFALGVLAVQVRVGEAPREPALVLGAVFAAGAVGFYLTLRWSARLGLPPWILALCQAVFALGCTLYAYTITGPIRGAALMVMVVVIVYCMFSLRPRQAAALTFTALAALALIMLRMARLEPQRYPPVVEALNFAVATLSMVSVTVLTAAMHDLRSRLKRQKEELLAAVARIQTLATQDELTALANRRHMNDMLKAEEQRLAARHAPTCLALIDIDFFKSVNDRFGHAGGDAVLRAFADAARSALRARDTCARWGGEEFLLMLPETSLEDAQRVLARVAERFATMAIPGIEPRVPITFSAGVAAHDAPETFAETIGRADKALYQAKSSGRNRILAA
ncbi:MAG: diguanylate cyclase [Telluria sp.]